jgi:hypothetical protein
MAMVRNVEVILGHCVEFCNNVHCHISVLFLDNVRKVGGLVLFITSYFQLLLTSLF